MAWGLVDQIDFGQCSLNGSFFNWRNDLRKIFEFDMDDEQRKTYGNLPTEYIIRTAKKFVDSPGVIARNEYPIDFRLESSQRKFGSLLELESGILAVDDNLKALIERLEPATHLFWSINIYHKNGSKTEKNYFGFIINQFFDSFIPDKSSEFYTHTNGKSYHANDFSLKCFSNICLDASIAKNKSIWRETKLISPEIMISDQLCDEIKKHGLKIFKHYKMGSI